MRTWITIAALFLGSCSAPGPSPDVATQASALVTAPDASAFAIYAKRSAFIDNGARVTGKVGVHAGSPAVPGKVLSDGVRLSIGPFARVGHAYAEDALISYGAEVDHAYVRALRFDGHASGDVDDESCLSMPTFPQERPVTPGATPLVVAASSTVTVASAGDYLLLQVERGGVLRLPGGNYQVGEVTLADGARLVALGSVEVRVAGRFVAGDGVRVGPSSGSALSLRLEALAKSGRPNRAPFAMSFGRGAQLRAIAFAPHGTLALGPASTSTGALVARDVWLGRGARHAFEGGLLPLPGSTPLAFDDAYRARLGATLTVSGPGVLANDLDPAYQPITAALVTHARSGTVTLSADGGFTYTPNPGFTGEDTYTYLASDGALSSAPATVRITVGGPNAAPRIVSKARRRAFVGERWVYRVRAKDADPGDALSYAVSGAPAGLVLTASTVTWSPAPAQVGPRSFTVTVTDAAGAAASQLVEVEVLPTAPLDRFVVFADNSLELHGQNYNGHVGARGTGPGTFLDHAVRASIYPTGVGELRRSYLLAESVHLNAHAEVHDVYANTFSAAPSARRGELRPFAPMPAMPAVGPFAPGTARLTIPGHQTQTLSPGARGDLVVASSGCARLLPGEYQFASVQLATRACLVALGPVTLRVAGRLDVGNRAFIGPGSGVELTVSELRIEVNGAAGNPKAVKLGKSASIMATVVAPSGHLELGDDAIAWGSLLARDVLTSPGSREYLGRRSATNRAPVITSTPIASAESGQPYAYLVTAADPDAGDALRYSLLAGPSGMSIDAISGLVSWPSPTSGSHLVTVQVSDRAGATATQSYTLVVAHINAAPYFTSSPVLTATVGVAYAYDADATDPDGDAITYALLAAPAGMTMSTSGLLSWTPLAGGTASVTIRAQDPSGAYATQSFSVSVAVPNRAPSFTSTPSLSGVAGQTYTYSPTAFDPDGDALTFSLVSGPAGMTLSAGTLSWLAVLGDAGVVLRVSDSRGGTADQSFTLHVVSGNRPPVFDLTPALVATAGVPYLSSTHASDPDGDSITYVLVSGPSGLTLTGAQLSWTPTRSQAGPQAVVLRASDGNGGLTEQPLSIQVFATNQPPTFGAQPPASATEGQPYTFALETSDPEGEAVTFGLDAGPAGMTVSPQGLIAWTPSSTQVATYSVTVRATDAGGRSRAMTFSVTVTGVNDAPSFTSTPVTEVDERASYLYTLAASDVDGDALSFELTAGPQGMTLTGAALAWTPEASDLGPHEVTVLVRDPAGLSDTQTYTLTVRDVNDPPAFTTSPGLFAAQHHAYVYAASAYDPDADDELEYVLDVAPSGMTVDALTGELRWTPSARQVGAYEVVLRVRDLEGELDVQSFTLSVADVNDLPAFTSTPVTIARENELYSYTLRATDPDAQDVLTYALVSGPLGLHLSGAELSWVPATRQLGAHAVTVRVSDGQGGTATQSFAISVQGGLACGLGVSGARCDALGFAHALSRDAVPLGAVQVTELPPTGVSRMSLADADTGLALLGGAGEGEYRFVFEAEGHVPVSGVATLSAGAVAWVGAPRLAPLTDLVASISPTGGYANDVDGRVSLAFPSGAVSVPATLSAAILDGGTLPSFAPRGYSPAVGLYYRVDAPVTLGPEAHFALPAPLGAGATLLLAEHDALLGEWRSLGVVTTTTADVRVTLGGPGGYALFVLDTGPGAPAVPALGATLEASTSTSAVATAASGRVVPETQAIGPDATEADVTGAGEAWITLAGAAASGVILPAKLSERYEYADGRKAEVAAIALALPFYRYPAVEGAPSGALSSRFAVRPRHAGAPSQLPDVHQTIALSATLPFEGAAIDASGGTVTAGDLQLTIPAGALDGPAIVHLAPLDAEGFELDGSGAERVFAVEWSSASLLPGHRIAVDMGAVTPLRNYVLARRELEQGTVSWQPVERMSSNSSGILSTAEAVLPGVTRSGTYALFPVTVMPGVIQGVARNTSSAPLEGVIVTLDGEPWTSYTSADGAYLTLAKPGDVRVRAERPPSTDTGFASGLLADAASILTLDVEVAPHAPFVVSVSPADGELQVAIVTAVDVRFSEPIAASSIASAEIAGVELTRSLSPDRRTLTLLPTRPLEHANTYTISVAGLEDDDGVAISGADEFSFTTLPAPTRPGQSALLTSYAPGAQHTPCAPYDPQLEAPDFDPTGLSVGVPGFDPQDATITCVVGSAGIANAGSTVILVNDDSGVTATVLARPNGAFKGFIRGAETDLLSAVLDEGNGRTRTVPLQVQRYDDGRVALYGSGGVVEGTNPFGGAPFELVIEAGAIARRGVFSFVPKTPADTLTAIGVAPEAGSLIVGASVRYQGDTLSTPAHVRFPMTLAQLQLPSGVAPEQAGFRMSKGAEVDVGDGPVTVYQFVDPMTYEDGALVTHSQFLLAAIEVANLAVTMLPGSPSLVRGFTAECTAIPSPNAAVGSNCGSYVPDSVRSSGDGTASLFTTRGTLDEGRIVSGAVLLTSAVTPGSSETQLLVYPRPRAGDTVAISDRAGAYEFMGFSGEPRQVLAWHPRFEHPAGAAFSAVEGTHIDLIFIPTPLTDPRRTLSLTHTPNSPGVWDGSQPIGSSMIATVEASAVGVAVPPVFSALTLKSIVALNASETAVPTDVHIAAASRPDVVTSNSIDRLWVVASRRAAKLTLELSATEGGQTVRREHVVYVGLPTAPPPTASVADPGDAQGPTLVRTDPPHGARGVPTTGVMRAVLSKPIDTSILASPSPLHVTGAGTTHTLSIDASGTELTVHFHGLQPGAHVSVELGNGITDLAGRAYDADPRTTSTNETTTVEFEVAPGAVLTTTVTPDPSRGGGPLVAGAVVHGHYAFVADRGQGRVLVYDVGAPPGSAPVREIAIPSGFPRELALVPHYSYLLPRSPYYPLIGQPIDCATVHGVVDPSGTQCRVSNRALLLVAGGIISVGGNQGGDGPHLTVLDITNPTSCGSPGCSFIVADVAIGSGPASAVGKLKWSAPIVSFLEQAGDSQFVQLANLHELIFGANLYPSSLRDLPATDSEGYDADGDGEYLGPNDLSPFPAADQLFPGLRRTLFVNDTTQRLQDYSVDGRALLVGVTQTAGESLDATPVPLASSYRTVSSGPAFNTDLPRSLASFPFPSAETADAVWMVHDARIPIYSSPNAPPDATPRDLALVTTSQPTPSGALVLRLYLIDVQNPLSPHVVGDPHGIELSNDAPQRIRSFERSPLDPATLILNAGGRSYLVDQDALGQLSPPAGTPHPALISVDTLVGGHGDVGRGAAGVTIDAYGTTVSVQYRGPQLRFLHFPDGVPSGGSHTVLFDGATTSSDDQIIRALAAARPLRSLPIGHVDPTRASAAEHPYVRVDLVCSGPNHPSTQESPGATLPLLLEGLDEAGEPIPDLGSVGFGPVRASSRGTGARGSLVAHRLSDDPTSAYYCVYLSEPFTLTRERIPTNDEPQQKIEGVSRRLFHSSARIRASIDESASGPSVEAYKSRVELGRTVPGAAVTADAYAALRIQGPNPEPVAGPVAKAPGTLGLVSAHNRELTYDTTDVSAPTGALPLALRRTYRGQDEVQSPLGLGFDFDYHQRIVVVASRYLLGGQSILEVDRASHDTIVRDGDVVLHPGDGRVLVFTKEPSGPRPTWVANDPLLDERVGTYAPNESLRWFKSPPGVFDVLVRFGDQGTFLRVTPSGSELRYDTLGRLSSIKDRFGNEQRLDYTLDGRLRRVRDLATLRSLELGYYLDANDPRADKSIDQTLLPGPSGLLARVKPDAGREICYRYDGAGRMSGFVRVSGACTDAGSVERTYQWRGERLYSLGGFDSQELLWADVTPDGEVQSTGGAQGATTLLRGPNLAASVDIANTTVVTADGTTTTLKFHASGLPREQEVTGGASPRTERTRTFFDDELRMTELVRPLGDSVRIAYPSAGGLRRAEGNASSETRIPIPTRTGDVLTTRYDAYQEKYNYLVDTTAPNGTRTVISPSAQGTYGATVTRSRLGAPTLLETRTRNGRGQLTEVDGDDGTVQTFDYGPDGLLTASHQGSLTTSYEYGCPYSSETGQPCRIIPSNGAPTELTLNARGLVTSERTAERLRTTEYDRNDRPLVAQTQAPDLYLRVERQYTQLGLETRRVQDDWSQGDPNHLSTVTSAPDAMGRLRSFTTEMGKTETYTYELGRLSSITGAGRLLSQTYDLNGNVLTRSDGVGTETYAYDGHNRVATYVGMDGAETGYGYAFDELRSTTTRDGSGTLGDDVTNAYDAAGRATSWSDGKGTWTYEQVPGESTLRNDALSSVSKTAWDTAGRVISQVEQGASETRSTTTVYDDGLEQRVTTTETSNAPGASPRERTTVHDALGHIKYLLGEFGSILEERDHRADGFLRSIKKGSGNPEETLTTYTASGLGEALTRTMSGGQTLTNEYDYDRRLTKEGAPGAQRKYGYDSESDNLLTLAEPDGATWTYSGHDLRGQPSHAVLSGGGPAMDMTYSTTGQLESRTTSFGGYTDRHHFQHDGLGRMTLARDDDSAGQERWSWRASHYVDGRVVEDLAIGALQLRTDTIPRPDGRVHTVLYPSGDLLEYARDPMGRVTEMQPSVMTAAKYDGTGALVRMTLGNGVVRTDERDFRGWLVARTYAVPGGPVLWQQRFGHDRAGHEILREDVSRTRASAWTYDAAGRLTTAAIDRRDANPSGGYAREYIFGTASDDLVDVISSPWAPPFAGVRSSSVGHTDSVVLAGSPHTRTRDRIGNTTSTPLGGGTAQLHFDGLSRLRRVDAANGTRVDYEYRADGPLLRRTVTCGAGASGCVSEIRTYVYSGLQLLVDYSQPHAAATPVPRGVYFYEDGSDIPIAADLRLTASSPPQRVYFVTDPMGSIIGVLDSSGAWVERMKYDPYGRVEYQQPDGMPPALAAVSSPGGTSLVVQATEPVAARATGTSTIPANASAPLEDAFAVKVAGSPIAGTWRYRDDYPGAPRETVVEFVPAAPISAGTAVSLVVHSGGLVDEWGGGIATATISVTWAGAGYVGPAPGSTMAGMAEVSYSGAALAWQSHLFDADVGLILARARVIDPITGVYLQRDPSGFSDSVNLYAVNRNDPINNRDPTGMFVPALLACAANPICRGAVIGASASIITQASRISEDSNMTWRDFSVGEVVASAAFGAATGGLIGSAGTAAKVALGTGALGLTAASVKADIDAGHMNTAALTIGLGALGAVSGGFSGGGGPAMNGGQAMAMAPALATSFSGALGGALAATGPSPIHGLGNIFSAARDSDPPPPTDQVPTVRGPDSSGRSVGQQQGRQNRIDWLEVNEFDPNQPSFIRGWLANERRRVELGQSKEPRTPPGFVQGHARQTPAREGYDYSNARLQGEDLNRLEEAVRRIMGVP